MKIPTKAAQPPVIDPDYQRRVAFLLGAVSNLIAAGGSRLYRQAFDLGLGEGRLLYVLGYERELTAARASQIMGIDKGATSRALEVLERRRLVTVSVDTTDARQRVIELTPAGSQLRDRLMSVILERERKLMAVFSVDEVATLSSLLQRLRAHVPTIREPAARGATPAPSPRQTPRQRRRR
jgi:DNA-binding MarR family transcriptional regulator